MYVLQMSLKQINYINWVEIAAENELHVHVKKSQVKQANSVVRYVNRTA